MEVLSKTPGGGGGREGHLALREDVFVLVGSGSPHGVVYTASYFSQSRMLEDCHRDASGMHPGEPFMAQGELVSSVFPWQSSLLEVHSPVR